MGIFITPPYIKPYIKVATWIIPMAYYEQDDNEYITDYGDINVTIKDNIKYFFSGRKIPMKTDAFNEPTQYKITITDNRVVFKPIEDFIKEVVRDRKFLETSGEFNLLDSSAMNFIQLVFNSLDIDIRSTISMPIQWLVYDVNNRILSRICWINEIKGDIVIRPYTQRGLLIEVHGNISYDKVNSYQASIVKRNLEIRNRLNDEWRSMVMESAVSEALKSITKPTEEKPRTKPGEEVSEEIGEVE